MNLHLPLCRYNISCSPFLLQHSTNRLYTNDATIHLRSVHHTVPCLVQLRTHLEIIDCNRPYQLFSYTLLNNKSLLLVKCDLAQT